MFLTKPPKQRKSTALFAVGLIKLLAVALTISVNINFSRNFIEQQSAVNQLTQKNKITGNQF